MVLEGIVSKRRCTLISLVILLSVFSGCATTIMDIQEDYISASASMKDFARITASDWMFGAGIIQGALPSDALPAWVSDEIGKVCLWTYMEGWPSEYQLGYMTGLRFRLAGPIIRSAIEQYRPGLLDIREVASFLMLFGL